MFPAADRADVQVIARGVFGSGLFNANPSRDGTDPNDSKLRLVRLFGCSPSPWGPRHISWPSGGCWRNLSVATMLVGINSIDHLRSTMKYVTTLPALGLIVASTSSSNCTLTGSLG